jgi:hypothetical protein
MSQIPLKVPRTNKRLHQAAGFQAAFYDQSWYMLRGRAALGDIRAWGIRRLRMTEDEHVELKAQLERLRQEHRDLDAAIEALQAVPGADAIQVQRLKKRRLGLRDRITFIEDQLTPDIIA